MSSPTNSGKVVPGIEYDMIIQNYDGGIVSESDVQFRTFEITMCFDAKTIPTEHILVQGVFLLVRPKND